MDEVIKSVPKIEIELYMVQVIGQVKQAPHYQIPLKLRFPCARIYIYVQKNAWQPPEGKCHVLRRHRGTRALVPRIQTPYLKIAFEKRIWLCIDVNN